MTLYLQALFQSGHVKTITLFTKMRSQMRTLDLSVIEGQNYKNLLLTMSKKNSYLF